MKVDSSWRVVDGKTKITSFEQLEVWRYSQDLAVSIYKLVKTFPAEEKFGLCSQPRRASSSISANIAEGFGRRSKKDKIHFYVMAYGSLLETKSHLYLAHRLNYVDKKTLTQNFDIIVSNQKLLNAFISSFEQ